MQDLAPPCVNILVEASPRPRLPPITSTLHLEKIFFGIYFLVLSVRFCLTDAGLIKDCNSPVAPPLLIDSFIDENLLL